MGRRLTLQISTILWRRLTSESSTSVALCTRGWHQIYICCTMCKGWHKRVLHLLHYVQEVDIRELSIVLRVRDWHRKCSTTMWSRLTSKSSTTLWRKRWFQTALLHCRGDCHQMTSGSTTVLREDWHEMTSELYCTMCRGLTSDSSTVLCRRECRHWATLICEEDEPWWQQRALQYYVEEIDIPLNHCWYRLSITTWFYNPIKRRATPRLD